MSETKGFFEEFDPVSIAVWREKVEEQLKGVPFEKKLVIQTPEGIPVQPIYRKEDVADNALAKTLPGQAPFVRGNRALGYKTDAWAIAQELPYASPTEFNVAAKADLARGQDALILRVGPGGLNLESKKDLKTALDGIDIHTVPIYLKGGYETCKVVSMLEDLVMVPEHGGYGYDIVGRLAELGRIPCDPADIFTQLVKRCEETPKGLRVLDVDVTVYGNAGGSAVVELAAAMATVATYMKELTERGLDATTAANNIRLVLGIGGDFFMELSKFRAARALWSNVMQAYGVSEPPLIFGAALNYNKTVYDPYVNLLRSTTEGFAGALGGADGMTLAPFDVLLGAPNSISRRIARNTQLVLRDEAHLTEVVDPAGGSWYVESLTRELCEKTWALFQEIEAEGGILEALVSKKMHGLCEECAEMRTKRLGQRRSVLVGTNMYANVGETLPTVAPASDTPLRVPEKGPALEIEPLNRCRLAEAYEALRIASAINAPVAFMANMGPVRQHKVRCDFASEFLTPAGFIVVADQTFESPEAAAAAAVDSGASVTVICSTDDTYPDLVPAFAKAVKAAKPDLKVVMAGLMPDYTDAFKEAGVDEFIHMKANNLQMLQSLTTGEHA